MCQAAVLDDEGELLDQRARARARSRSGDYLIEPQEEADKEKP